MPDSTTPICSPNTGALEVESTGTGDEAIRPASKNGYSSPRPARVLDCSTPTDLAPSSGSLGEIPNGSGAPGIGTGAQAPSKLRRGTESTMSSFASSREVDEESQHSDIRGSSDDSDEGFTGSVLRPIAGYEKLVCTCSSWWRLLRYDDGRTEEEYLRLALRDKHIMVIFCGLMIVGSSFAVPSLVGYHSNAHGILFYFGALCSAIAVAMYAVAYLTRGTYSYPRLQHPRVQEAIIVMINLPVLVGSGTSYSHSNRCSEQYADRSIKEVLELCVERVDPSYATRIVLGLLLFPRLAVSGPFTVLCTALLFLGRLAVSNVDTDDALGKRLGLQFAIMFLLLAFHVIRDRQLRRVFEAEVSVAQQTKKLAEKEHILEMGVSRAMPSFLIQRVLSRDLIVDSGVASLSVADLSHNWAAQPPPDAANQDPSADIRLSNNDPHYHYLKLVSQLQNQLDVMAALFQVQRTKTVGDSFVTLCGLAPKSTDHACRLCALAIRQHTACEEIARASIRGYDMKLKVGIHTAQTLGILVGTHRPYYDVFGRLEPLATDISQLAEPGTTLISDETQMYVATSFRCTDVSFNDVNLPGNEVQALFRLVEPMANCEISMFADADPETPKVVDTTLRTSKYAQLVGLVGKWRKVVRINGPQAKPAGTIQAQGVKSSFRRSSGGSIRVASITSRSAVASAPQAQLNPLESGTRPAGKPPPRASRSTWLSPSDSSEESGSSKPTSPRKGRLRARGGSTVTTSTSAGCSAARGNAARVDDLFNFRRRNDVYMRRVQLPSAEVEDRRAILSHPGGATSSLSNRMYMLQLDLNIGRLWTTDGFYADNAAPFNEFVQQYRCHRVITSVLAGLYGLVCLGTSLTNTTVNTNENHHEHSPGFCCIQGVLAVLQLCVAGLSVVRGFRAVLLTTMLHTGLFVANLVVLSVLHESFPGADTQHYTITVGLVLLYNFIVGGIPLGWIYLFVVLVVSVLSTGLMYSYSRILIDPNSALYELIRKVIMMFIFLMWARTAYFSLRWQFVLQLLDSRLRRQLSQRESLTRSVVHTIVPKFMVGHVVQWCERYVAAQKLLREDDFDVDEHSSIDNADELLSDVSRTAAIRAPPPMYRLSHAVVLAMHVPVTIFPGWVTRNETASRMSSSSSLMSTTNRLNAHQKLVESQCHEEIDKFHRHIETSLAGAPHYRLVRRLGDIWLFCGSKSHNTQQSKLEPDLEAIGDPASGALELIGLQLAKTLAAFSSDSPVIAEQKPVSPWSTTLTTGLPPDPVSSFSNSSQLNPDRFVHVRRMKFALNSGDVYVGAVGSQLLSYNLTGTVMTTALGVLRAAPPGTVTVCNNNSANKLFNSPTFVFTEAESRYGNDGQLLSVFTAQLSSGSQLA